MGLDITAYSCLSAKPEITSDTCEELYEMYVWPWPSPNFPGRFDGLVECAHTFGEEHSFGAGSYSAYNNWREQLAELAGYAPRGSDPRHAHSRGAWESGGGPFWELIHFSDCEGWIGPVAAKKLLRDFEEYAERAESIESPWFFERYQDWLLAFRLAADGGGIRFS